MVALEASTLAAERREDARTANPAVSTLSRHVDAIEAHVDDVLTFFSLAEANPQALSNLLARLQRVQQTIETAARK
jgi:ABC-type transporter Mla subunit MlaD